ncbi:MAG: hypothetical protein GTO45_12845 [Candidatus Aminicenantes bacterium]|nr:hypothetical protein [Candidatus Aminicenantes bacterium]NIM79672.1 hypothetical protein [Candidatus Aminicenantes bacterium]NIN18998.1 hypothetical protein [Candidatus Aminicenantes bacterium]NIN42900.1 hypothetical protein [Candidatus Aminicenantes bacterium]NIN85637.1 hypothetical protein [Candidatus Aminicenantes bacterium]
MGKKSGSRKKSRKKSGSKKIVRLFTVTTILAALILLSIHAFIDLFEKDIFDVVIKQIEKNSGGVYTIKYDRVDLNFFQRSIHIKNFSINLDKTALNKISTESAKKKLLINTKLPVLKIEGISIFNLIFSKSVSIKNLSLEGEELVIFKRTEPHKKNPILHIPKCSLHFSRLKINRGVKKNIFFYFKSGEFTLEEPRFIFPQGFYILNAKKLNFSKLTSSLSIHSLELIPAYSKYRFARLKGYRTNRISLKIDNIEFKDIDFNDLFKNQCFHARLLTIERPELDIFRDRSVPKGSGTKEKKFPQQLLRELTFKLGIDEIEISNGGIVFSVSTLIHKRRKSGNVFFTDINANIKNVTNDTGLLKKKASTEVNADAKLMGKGILNANLTIPIHSKRNRFTFSGSLGTMKMKEFNSILENTAYVRINRGIINRLDFSARANNKRIKGEMKLLYNDLKISILKKVEKREKKKLVSFLANIILRGNNPKKGKPARIGKINYEKERPMTMFGYIWKSLLSGIKSSIR